MTGNSGLYKGTAGAKAALETTLHVNGATYAEFERIMAFNKGKTKKEVLAAIISKEAAKLKGKKPPKK